MTELPINQVVCGDCREVMRGFPDASIHAIVTDPPYGLEFMGEEWDKFGRDLKTQASAKFVSIGRGTQMEGCGFDKKAKPSFYNLSRPRPKGHFGRAGEEGEQDLKVKKDFTALPRFFKSDMENYQEWTTSWATEALRVLKPGASMFVMGGTRTYHRMACGIEDAGFVIKDCLMWCYASGFPKAVALDKLIDKRAGAERKIIGKARWSQPAKSGHHAGLLDKHVKMAEGRFTPDVTSPATDLAKKWEGWKVGGLKPAYEPIVWAIKPPEGSYVDNVLKHGVGAVNVDECRIPYESEKDRKRRKRGVVVDGKDLSETMWNVKSGYKTYDSDKYMSEEGRFPANMIRTDEFHDGYDRFFFIPKAGRGERDEGLDLLPDRFDYGDYGNGLGKVPKETGKRPSPAKNIHPTVKPVRLMEHLIKLVTREGQIVLDPFVGSGTTCVAARMLNRRYIGIDLNPEYVEIAKRRLATIPKPLEVFR
jgi:site-specific DNA-methyltransferase (adenine-specific)